MLKRVAVWIAGAVLILSAALTLVVTVSDLTWLYLVHEGWSLAPATVTLLFGAIWLLFYPRAAFAIGCAGALLGLASIIYQDQRFGGMETGYFIYGVVLATAITGLLLCPVGAIDAAVKRRRTKRLAVALTSFMVLFSITAILSRRSYAGQAEKLPRALAEARALGIPVTPDELRQMVALPDEVNAATDYWTAFRNLEEPDYDRKRGDAESALTNGEATPEQKRLLRAELAAEAARLKSVERASHKSGADWKRKWEEGPALLFPEFAPMKRSAKLLRNQALFESEAGHVIRAYQLLITAARVGKHAGDDPELIGALVNYAIDYISLNAAASVLNAHHNAISRMAAQKFLSQLPPTSTFRHAIPGELMRIRAEIKELVPASEQLSRTDTPLMLDPIEWILIHDPLYRQALESQSIQYWIDHLKIIRKQNPLPEREKELQELFYRYENEPSVSSGLAPILLPEFSQAYRAEIKPVAMRRMLSCAIQIYQVYEESGKLPGSLLRLKDVIDPYDGKSIRYRTDGRTFRLYCIGTDLEDNGGLTPKEKASSSGRGRDLVMIFSIP